MSDKPKDGGPAFPQIETIDDAGDMNGDKPFSHVYSRGGMSLRDYFAAQCFSVLIVESGEEDYDEAARDAYRRADALLKARESQ